MKPLRLLDIKEQICENLWLMSAWADYAIEKAKRLEYILRGGTVEQATKKTPRDYNQLT